MLSGFIFVCVLRLCAVVVWTLMAPMCEWRCDEVRMNYSSSAIRGEWVVRVRNVCLSPPGVGLRFVYVS